MRKKRLLWQLFPTYLLVTGIALLAATWFASRSLRQFYLERTAESLESRARLIEADASRLVLEGTPGLIDSFCKVTGARASVRITVMLPNGQVVGDTDEDPTRMENHAQRPEMQAALAGQPGVASRFSHTVQEDMMYVAIPLGARDRMAGVARVSVPLAAIDRVLGTLYVKIAVGGLVVALMAALLSLALARRVSRPLEELKQGAERFAHGNLEQKLAVPDSDELGGLAEAMNQMAAQLDERIRNLLRQRNELEAVLSSMVEGVLAVDNEERLLTLNRAAADFMDIDARTAIGRSIQEIVRNPDLQRFVSHTRAGQAPAERDIVLHVKGERLLQAQGTVLRDAQGAGIGALVVLNDVTRLRRLENVRRDFVANVSHELKTPITSIKGFVETLQEGAIRDPEESRKFLGIIARQADRLNAIIEDLLVLSKIEQEEEQESIVLEQSPLREVLQSAIQACTVKAAAKEIAVRLTCAEDLAARVNPPLLEQALVNLIDNAIKYSEPKGEVEIQASRNGTGLRIAVRDHGCGIAKEHLDRIFERFYRVDKARSRKLGGTGLGLAIVKHIAQAHGGRVEVESIPEKGSLFTIQLPLGIQGMDGRPGHPKTLGEAGSEARH